jgi:hypothetical protein
VSTPNLNVEHFADCTRWQELEEAIPTGQWQYFERGDRV